MSVPSRVVVLPEPLGPRKPNPHAFPDRHNPARVDASDDQAIPLSASQRAGQDLVGYAIEAFVKLAVPSTTISELSQNFQGPPAVQ